jgi:hypothetical protein
MTVKLLKYMLVLCVAFFGFSIQASADVGGGQSNNAPGALKSPVHDPAFPSCWTYNATFLSAGDVLTFDIEKTEDTAAGIIRVQTRDCCIVGDEWQADIMSRKPRFKSDVATGDGNTSTFTGDAYVAPFNAGTVDITYSAGVDAFAAGMTVEICYSREREDGNDELIIVESWYRDAP